jgi:hypothetical protein
MVCNLNDSFRRELVLNIPYGAEGRRRMDIVARSSIVYKNSVYTLVHLYVLNDTVRCVSVSISLRDNRYAISIPRKIGRDSQYNSRGAS